MEKKSVIILIWVVFTFLRITPVCSRSRYSPDDEFIFYGFATARMNVDDGSDVIVDGKAYRGHIDGSADIYLRLTDNTSNSYGHAFYEYPFSFIKNGKAVSFSTCFAFAVVPEYERLGGGGGLAFVMSPTRDLSGAYPAQYLGLLNTSTDKSVSNHLLAIEFDTVQDLEFHDIDDNHIGIDINSLTSNASVSAAYWTDDGGGMTSTNLSLKSGNTIKAWIEYDSESRLLNVTVSPFDKKPPKAILSYEVDLSLVFKDKMYVGFSASSGLLASKHYVFGWSFKVNGTASDLRLSLLPSLPKPGSDDTSSPSVPDPAGNEDTCSDDICKGILVAAVFLYFFFLSWNFMRWLDVL